MLSLTGRKTQATFLGGRSTVLMLCLNTALMWMKVPTKGKKTTDTSPSVDVFLYEADSQHDAPPCHVAVLFECSMEEFHFSSQTFLLADGSVSVYWSGQHRVLIERFGGGVTHISDTGWCGWASCTQWAPRNQRVFCIRQSSRREGDS